MGFISGLRRNESTVVLPAIEGLDQRKKSLDIGLKAELAQNARFGDEVGSVTKRSVIGRYNGTVETAYIAGIYRYYRPSTATGYLLQVNSTTLKVGDDSAKTFATTLWTYTGTPTRMMAVVYQDLCYVATDSTNAADNIMVTDGVTAWELGSCKAVISASAGLLDTTAVYYYSIGYNTNADGTSGTATIPGAKVKVTSGTAKGIDLSHIPLGDSSQGSRVIYRTIGGGSTLEWVHTLGDNTTTTWTDTAIDTVAVTGVTDGTPDAIFDCASAHGLQVGDRVTLSGFDPITSYNHSGTVTVVTDADSFRTGQAYDTSTDTGTMAIGEDMGTVTDDVPRGPYLYTGQERLFITGDANWKSHIFYSDQFLPHWIKTGTAAFATTEASDYYDVVNEDDGDVITGMVTQLGITYVFKQNHIYPYYIKGTPAIWSIEDSVSPIGAPAGYSIQPTEYGVVYQGWHFLYLFDGHHSRVIADEFTVEENIAGARITKSFGYFWRGLYLLAYTDKNAGNDYHDRVFVYDMLRKQGSIDVGGSQSSGTGNVNINCFTSFKGEAEWDQLYAGDSNLGWVYEYEKSLITTQLQTITDIDAGTHSDTDAFGIETNPILSRPNLDDMEYSTDTLAQAAWVSSDTGDYDTENVLNLHLENDVTDSSDSGHTVTNTSVTFDTTNKKFGSYGALFNGTSAFLTVPDSADFDLCKDTTSYTIDFWLKLASLPGVNETWGLVQQYQADSPAYDWRFYLNEDGTIVFHCFTAGSAVISLTGGTAITNLDWHHIALVKNSTVYTIYIDGVSSSTVTDTSTAEFAGNVYIGKYVDSGGVSNYLDGYMDEVRISKGIVRWTTTFEPPLHAYGNNVQTYSGSTINHTTNTPSNYSLQIEAIKTNSLNDTIDKTITEIDLSAAGHDRILIDVYAFRTGTNFQLGIDETGGDFSGTGKLQNVAVTTSNTWETVVLNYSTVTDAAKDAIVLLRLKITNADHDNVIYIDNIRTGFTGVATYTSPIYNINAARGVLGKMYWNEALNTKSGTYSTNNVQFWVRTGTTSAACGTATYRGLLGAAKSGDNGLTTPAGDQMYSAASSVTTAYAYMQFTMEIDCLDATEYLYAPYLYKAGGFVIKFTYYQAGTDAEDAVTFRYSTGFRNYGKPMEDKIFKKIVSMHEGDTGTFDIIATTDLQDEQVTTDNSPNTFNDIDLTTYGKRWTSNFPSNMYGRELKLEWYKSDTEDFRVKQYGIVTEILPVI